MLVKQPACRPWGRVGNRRLEEVGRPGLGHAGGAWDGANVPIPGFLSLREISPPVIDIATEQLVPMRDIPAMLPSRPGGRKLHLSVPYRWASSGVRGVRLEVIRIGGTTFSSVQAIQRFGEKLSELPAMHTAPTPKRREQSLCRISERVAEELGFSNRRRNSDQAATAPRS